ncbi:iron ABC transporter permease [Blastopirellula sp. JC732]|uniref:Iron ABC transporter permease n=1 Tax=Blastopirellula sediminis TaxID=2894196 RepID=A0A9X1MPT9_9BACT|nr:iron ABC transporter permease [Blastopirellula sediminis]MCC9606191.1 iron ABC transporter permease [Blastopirellula sediminis]MCC9630511.1 iron ABC transporter permease [Blastopirellula sediminis]
MSPVDKRTVSLLFVLAVLACLVSLCLGSQWISPVTLVSSLTGQGDETYQMVFWSFRLPRVLMVMLVGWGIAISGVLMQGVLRNDLADPGIMGVAAGGNFGVTLALLIFGTQIASPWTIPLVSIAGAIGTVTLVCGLAFDRRGLYPARLLLTAVAVTAALGSFTLVLSLNVDREVYAQALAWTTGSFSKADWNYVVALTVWLGLLSMIVLAICPVMNVLRLKDESVVGLGLDVFRWRVALLVLAVTLGASSMAMSGGLVFLGLIAPHIARRLVGPQHFALVPAAGMVGMLLLMSADAGGRSLFAPVEIPAGIMTGAIGGMYFVYQLMTTKG